MTAINELERPSNKVLINGEFRDSGAGACHRQLGETRRDKQLNFVNQGDFSHV